MGKIKRELGPTGEAVRTNIRKYRRWMPITVLSEKLAVLGRPIPPLGLRRIESGARRVDVDDLVAIASALEIPVIDLMSMAP